MQNETESQQDQLQQNVPIKPAVSDIGDKQSDLDVPGGKGLIKDDASKDTQTRADWPGPGMQGWQR